MGLIATICPQAPDAAACEAAITEWWDEIAKCLFPEFLGGSEVCVKLGLCKKDNPLVRDWTCEECTAIMARVAEFIKDPETEAKGIAFLQGDCFCGQPGHTADCKSLVSWLRPPLSCARMWLVSARSLLHCLCPHTSG